MMYSLRSVSTSLRFLQLVSIRESHLHQRLCFVNLDIGSASRTSRAQQRDTVYTDGRRPSRERHHQGLVHDRLSSRDRYCKPSREGNNSHVLHGCCIWKDI